VLDPNAQSRVGRDGSWAEKALLECFADVKKILPDAPASVIVVPCTRKRVAARETSQERRFEPSESFASLETKYTF